MQMKEDEDSVPAKDWETFFVESNCQALIRNVELWGERTRLPTALMLVTSIPSVVGQKFVNSACGAFLMPAQNRACLID